MNKRLFTFLVYVLLTQYIIALGKNGWVITTHSNDNYKGVTLANGRIGLVSGSDIFNVSDIILNGVYDKEDKEGVSRIVRGPVFTNIVMKIDGEDVTRRNSYNWEQSLNMKEAYLETKVETSKASISQSLRALRNFPYMALSLVTVIPNQNIDLEVINSIVFPVELQNTSTSYKMLKDGEIELPVYVSTAKSRTGMQELATCSAFLFDTERPDIRSYYGVAHYQSMGFKVHLEKGVSYRFALIGSICSSRDFANPRAEAERMAVYALQSDIEHFLDGHKREWERLWQSDIIIEGDDEAQRDIRLALYNLYSFTGENTRLSIPPMGLSTVTGYNGHVFWDTELWMYPPLLMLNADMAKSCIDYRTDRLSKAIQRATVFGYKGCMFPWESDDSGEEATPTWCLTGPFEHHITADVAIAFWNYYCVTKDIRWLHEEGIQVLSQAADFWVSRAVRNSDGSYSINNVVGPDEFAPNVDDNAFTNGSAKTALLCAIKAAKILKQTYPSEWETVANGICFHYFPDGVMKEHKAYDGAVVKQADVNLLSYPLNILTGKENIKKNVDYYSKKIYEDGPAMGNAILAILYAQLGDREKSYEFFKKSYLSNKRPPFGVLSESAFSNNPYFCTGAGGLLQVLLSGFGGLRITDKGIVQEKPLLPPHWKSLTLKGIGLDKKSFVVK